MPTPLQLTCDRNEGRRRAYLWTPPHVHTAAPLMLAFHGAGSNARDMAQFCGLPDFCEQHGILLALPDGTGRQPQALSWNAGPGNVYAARHGIDDVGFVVQLLEQLTADFPIDPHRIFAVGMSNGGLMCYRLAAELGARLAGIAAVGCSAVDEMPLPAMPIATLHIHGTDDDLVPFEGGRGGASFTQTKFLPVLPTVERWAANNGCRTIAQTRHLANGSDGTWAECHDFTGDRNSQPVRLVVIHGGGHTWPGHPTSHEFLGVTSDSCDANDVIWRFLKDYRHSDAAD